MQSTAPRAHPWDSPAAAADAAFAPLLEAARPAPHLGAMARGTVDRLVEVERTALPSFHWLQGTLGSGMMVSGLFYGALGGGTPAEEVLARAAVVTGSHWYVAGVREVLAAALEPAPREAQREASLAAAAAVGAWVGVMAGSALLGASFRPAQYAGLAVYHAAMMTAAACLRHAHTLESRRGEAGGGGTAHRNLAWAVVSAAVVGCASIAIGGSFWLTSRGSSIGALAAGGAGSHAILGACRAMGLSQARALAHRRPPAPAPQAEPA